MVLAQEDYSKIVGVWALIKTNQMNSAAHNQLNLKDQTQVTRHLPLSQRRTQKNS